MPTEFKLPELGENVTAGDVVRVLVKPGDAITNDQPVLELETDKATIEVPSSVSGTIKDVKVKTGDTVKVGQTVLVVEDSGAAKQTTEARGDGPKPQPVAAPEEGGLSQKAPGQPDAAPAESGGEGGNGDAHRASEWEVDAEEPETDAGEPAAAAETEAPPSNEPSEPSAPSGCR